MVYLYNNYCEWMVLTPPFPSPMGCPPTAQQRSKAHVNLSNHHALKNDSRWFLQNNGGQFLYPPSWCGEGGLPSKFIWMPSVRGWRNRLYTCIFSSLLNIILQNSNMHIPYSAKFSRHLYFVDWPLKAISLHNVRGMTAYRKPRL